MKIELIKCHGSGNDFLLIDAVSQKFSLATSELRAVSRALCHRHSGIGADGLLWMCAGQREAVRMRMFNPDGSEAEMCGNGIRCVARLAMQLQGCRELPIETMKAIYRTCQEDDLVPDVPAFSVEIASVSLRPADLPFHIDAAQLIEQPLPDLPAPWRFTAISLTNPHLIAFTDTPDESLLIETGQRANADHRLFPQGVNVSLAVPLPKRDNAIFVRTWERGAGLTAACGTALSAASLAACLTGRHRFGEWLTVYNKGGLVQCLPQHRDDRYAVRLLGNATFDYQQLVELDAGHPEAFQTGQRMEFPDEQAAYRKLLRQAARSCGWIDADGNS